MATTALKQTARKQRRRSDKAEEEVTNHFNLFVPIGHAERAETALRERFKFVTITYDVKYENQPGAVMMIEHKDTKPEHKEPTLFQDTASPQLAKECQRVSSATSVQPGFPPSIGNMEGFALLDGESLWVLSY